MTDYLFDRITERKIEGYVFDCPFCDRELTALNKRQLLSNARGHILSHKEGDIDG